MMCTCKGNWMPMITWISDTGFQWYLTKKVYYFTQNFSDLCTGLHSSLPDLTSASYSSKVLGQKKRYDQKNSFARIVESWKWQRIEVPKENLWGGGGGGLKKIVQLSKRRSFSVHLKTNTSYCTTNWWISVYHRFFSNAVFFNKRLVFKWILMTSMFSLRPFSHFRSTDLSVNQPNQSFSKDAL